MKKLKTLLLIILTVSALLCFIACTEKNEKQDIKGISFPDRSFTYDGPEKKVEIEGELPNGVSVVYENNTATEVGTYTAKAVISGENYNTLTLTCTLTVNGMNLTGITFPDRSFTYDGTEKKVEIEGELPDGVSVVYENNTATDAGTYTAKAVISGKNYNTLTLTCTLTVNGMNLTSITFPDRSFTYDGTEKKVEIEGELPDGVSVVYENNTATDAGTYSAKAVISGKNYNTLTLYATLKIRENFSGMATKILKNLLQIPDVEQFLPVGLKMENIAYSGNELDFSEFVNIASIPDCGIGKQLHVMYGAINKFQTALDYLLSVNSAFNAIESLYQNFLNENPENYTVYDGNYESFSFHIELNEASYAIEFNYKSAGIKITYDDETGTNIGKITLTDGIAAKYVIKNNFVKIGVQTTVQGVGYVSQLEFSTQNGVVEGKLFEFVGTENKSIKTSAMIFIDSAYTSIISDKRETDDLSVEGEVEVYVNATGRLIGTEIKETVNSISYDTLWINLRDVNGLTSVKVTDSVNGMNMNTVYVNGSENPFVPKKVGGIGLTMLSRRFDIEMKEMYFYVYDEETKKYDELKMLLPMLFVQREFLNYFEDDVFETNSDNGISSDVKITLPDSENRYLTAVYSLLIENYKIIKESESFDSVSSFIHQ